jgi:hypothetical protein
VDFEPDVLAGADVVADGEGPAGEAAGGVQHCVAGQFREAEQDIVGNRAATLVQGTG